MTALPDTPSAAELRAAVALLENHGDIVGNVSAAMLKRMRNAATALEDAAPAPAHSSLDRAVDYLTDRGACPECGHPVHTTSGPDRGWIHTETGQYTCPPGTAGSMAGPATTDDQLQAKYDEITDAEKLATEQGRTEMRQELEDALFEAISQVGDDATADELREALASAWEATPA